MKETVGFIGLGNMGLATAGNRRRRLGRLRPRGIGERGTLIGANPIRTTRRITSGLSSLRATISKRRVAAAAPMASRRRILQWQLIVRGQAVLSPPLVAVVFQRRFVQLTTPWVIG